MPFQIGPRPFAALAAEANGNLSREGGNVDPAVASQITANMLLGDGPNGLVPYDGVLPLKGVSLVYPNELGRISYAAREAELKGWEIVYRTTGPLAVTGAYIAADSVAGNLTLNGVNVAITAKMHLRAIVQAITASGAGVTATLVGGDRIRLVADAGGPLVIAGDAGVVTELGFVAGPVAPSTQAQIVADDNAALADLGLRVR